MNRAVYQHGRYPDLDVTWEDAGLINLTGHVIQLDVFAFGGPTLFTKTTGFTIPPLVAGIVQDPNLIVAWSGAPGAELDGLAAGQYVLKFTDNFNNELYGELIVRVNAPNFGYCEISDLLIGDLAISATVNKYDYINGAADEMNASLGQRYHLPLALTAAPAWITFKLKSINQRLATGRLVQSLAVAHEDASVNAYGQKLIDGALGELSDIANGGTALPGVLLEPTSIRSTAPSILNHDAFSAIDQFEEGFMRPRQFPSIRKTIWRPGPAVPGEVPEGTMPP